MMRLCAAHKRMKHLLPAQAFSACLVCEYATRRRDFAVAVVCRCGEAAFKSFPRRISAGVYHNMRVALRCPIFVFSSLNFHLKFACRLYMLTELPIDSRRHWQVNSTCFPNRRGTSASWSQSWRPQEEECHWSWRDEEEGRTKEGCRR
jgi:hypothetical protein